MENSCHVKSGDRYKIPSTNGEADRRGYQCTSWFLQESTEEESVEDQPVTGLEFPSLSVCAAVEEQVEEVGALLSFRTPVIQDFSGASKKALYSVSVKVLNRTSLAGVQEPRWSGVLTPGSSPKGSWRSLYKPPIEKRTAALQWRVVHGAGATNRHVAHIDPGVGSQCLFCDCEESLQHLWLGCPRLSRLFSVLQQVLSGLGELLEDSLFVFGPRYTAAQRSRVSLVNFLIGQAKMSIWLSRRNRMKGLGSTDATLMFRGLVATRLNLHITEWSLI